jgi:Ca-activated chloride channel family protein
MNKFKAALTAAAFLSLPIVTPASACEVALAMTIDVSGSVDAREFRLQMNGLADALSDPIVAGALIEAQAMVSVMQWSGAGRQKMTLEWTQIKSRADIAPIIQTVRSAPRAYKHFSTAIGDALLAANALHGQVAGVCERKVIDVSGDGPSNEGPDVARIRDQLLRTGVTINGLAIETGSTGITNYYRSNVIGGPGAFVVTADDYTDYARAIRRKLLSEITKPIVQLNDGTNDG